MHFPLVGGCTPAPRADASALRFPPLGRYTPAPRADPLCLRFPLLGGFTPGRIRLLVATLSFGFCIDYFDRQERRQCNCAPREGLSGQAGVLYWVFVTAWASFVPPPANIPDGVPSSPPKSGDPFSAAEGYRQRTCHSVHLSGHDAFNG